MTKKTATFLFILITTLHSYSQTNFSSNPDSSVFLTQDVNKFWKAFDLFTKDTSRNPFGTDYISIGSAGVKGFTPNRIESAEHLFATIKRRKADYEAVRENTLRIKEKEK